MILDTSIFISAERRQWNARQRVSYLERAFQDEEMRLPATAAAELIHGIFRAKVPQQVTDRSNFVKEVLYVLPVITFSETTAWIAGRIRGEQARNGNTLPFADSLIAASALELQDAVVTTNVFEYHIAHAFGYVRIDSNTMGFQDVHHLTGTANMFNGSVLEP